MSLGTKEGPPKISELDTLIGQAPSALVRQEACALLVPDKTVWGDNILNIVRAYPPPDLDLAGAMFKQWERRYSEGNVQRISGTTPRLLLQEGLQLPQKDLEGDWYRNIIGDFSSFMKQGVREYSAAWRNYPSFALGIASNTWFKDVRFAAKSGFLWEFGVVLEKEDKKLSVASIGVPWDETETAWYKRITPQVPFMGSEELLEQLGAPLGFPTRSEKNKTQLEKQLNEPKGTDGWWAEVIDCLQKQQKPVGSSLTWTNFSKRVRQNMQKQVEQCGSETFFGQVCNMYGYYIAAWPEKLSDNLYGCRQELSIDPIGWLEEK